MFIELAICPALVMAPRTRRCAPRLMRTPTTIATAAIATTPPNIMPTKAPVLSQPEEEAGDEEEPGEEVEPPTVDRTAKR